VDRTFRIYLWLAFGITWGAGGLGLLVGALRPDFAFSSSQPLYFVAGFGPSIAGFIMTWHVEGRAGLWRLLARVVPSRAGLPWYPVVIVGLPAVDLLAGWLVDPDIVTRLPPWDRLFPLLALTLVTESGRSGKSSGGAGSRCRGCSGAGRPSRPASSWAPSGAPGTYRRFSSRRSHKAICRSRSFSSTVWRSASS
jgi:hypothetical protein